MKYNQNDLEALIEFIDRLANEPGNEVFKNRLINIITKNIRSTQNSISDSLDEKLSRIEEYLSIRFDDIIDYSHFDDPVKRQLIIDCIEMCRYKYGTVNHKIDFGEFCRYAHLQAEEMINYLLLKITNSSISEIEIFIKEKNAAYKPDRKPNDLSHINYLSKLLAVKNAYKMEGLTHVYLWFLNDFRNELSHRNSLSVRKDDESLIAYEKAGFNDKTINPDSLDAKDKIIYNKGEYVKKKRAEDFKAILKILTNLKQLVVHNCKNKYTPSTHQPTIGSANPILNEIKKTL